MFFFFFFSILMQHCPECQILLSKYLCVWDCSHPLKGLALIILCLLDGRCCCCLGQLLLDRWDHAVVAQLLVSPGYCLAPVSFLTPLFVLRPCRMQYSYLFQLTICLSLKCPPKGYALRWASWLLWSGLKRTTLDLWKVLLQGLSPSPGNSG